MSEILAGTVMTGKKFRTKYPNYQSITKPSVTITTDGGHIYWLDCTYQYPKAEKVVCLGKPASHEELIAAINQAKNSLEIKPKSTHLYITE